MNNTIETNDRFDRLTNLDISTHYGDKSFYFGKNDFLSAFGYWVIAQSPYDVPAGLANALTGYDEYLRGKFPKPPLEYLGLDLAGLDAFVSEDIFGSIEAIRVLNDRKNGNDNPLGFCDRYSKPSPDNDFIDLGALAHNIKYMLFRERICTDI